MAHVELRNLRKVYGKTVAVDGVDLQIGKGEFMTLLGPSGCGKTTTLRMIAGLVEPTGGEIRVGDKLLSSPGAKMVPPEKRNMGMVFQSYAVWPHMKVFDNVAFPLHNLKKPKEEIRRRVHAALELVQLNGLEDRYPTHLSGGQQQRVALARAMAIEPDTLLFDEPLSNLDAKLREEMRFELKEIQRRIGVTSIYVTHDQAEAMAISDRIAVMLNGRIKQVGTPCEIYDDPQDPFTAEFIGLANLDAKLREEMRFELKEIQRRIGVTSIYVTHDQAEAMAISDRIAVMLNGRIKQVGTPCEIYDDPQDPFTAEFIGLANLLPAKVTAESTVCLSGKQEIDIEGCRALPMAADVVISIRPHNIRIHRPDNQTRNELAGVVEKGSYLGDKVDYRVRVGEHELRVQTAPGEVYADGTAVSLQLPGDKIRVISIKLR